MLEECLDILLDTTKDSLRILPFLFVTYLIMEYIGHKSNTKMQSMIKKAGKYGPALGGVLGAFPQCGFSAAAASLYSGEVISLGTLLAIFWSTSDEMLPIMISEAAPISVLLKMICFKIVLGIVFGFLIDLLFRNSRPTAKMGRRKTGSGTGTLCENGLCNCKKVITTAAVKHTLQTIGFIFLVSLVMNILVAVVGEDAIAGIVANRPVIGPFLAGIVGLIPNCAASVVITQLYLEGMMSFGTTIAGLMVGAGIGLIILAKENKDKKDNIKIVALLYGFGVLSGIVINLIETFL